ncbi:DUF4132 domain-containing protein [Rapidithrix thailandica]|uniref:DUF4132 domain-containing protein n=1 Tax=Rapidithrix thailandica TaxID=413964 RepID=A0AAW9RTG9_9BACT
MSGTEKNTFLENNLTPDDKPKNYQLSEGDEFGKYVNEQVAAFTEEEQNIFGKIFQHALTATMDKPSQKWLKQAKELIKALKRGRYKQVIQEVLDLAVTMKVTEVVETTEYKGRTTHYTHQAYFTDKNALVLKGLIWTVVAYCDRKNLLTLAQLTERAFQEIPGQGAVAARPAAAGVGNACIFVLGNSKMEEGVNHLIHLKSSIRQESTQKIIQKYIEVASKKLGLAQPYHLSEGDEFGKYVNAKIAALEGEERVVFYGVFQHALTATASKPSSSWLMQVKTLIKSLKKDRYKQVMQDILGFATELTITEVTEIHAFSGRQYTVHKYFTDKNKALLKGLVWTMVAFHDRVSLLILARLTEFAFQTIPDVGPAASGVGNACIYVLAHSKGVEGVSYLSRLKLKIRQNNTQKLIQQYIDEAAKKLGISTIGLEELSVPDFGLIEGKKTVAFDDYQLELAITGIGKTQLTWYKPDGNPQKSVPAFVKSTQQHKDRLKRLKDEIKQIQKYSTAQRDRIDRLFIQNHIWSYETFQTYYLEHGLVCTIARKLIWTLTTDGQKTEAVFHKDQWEDVQGKSVEVGPETQVVLWHPIHSDTDTILAWRDRLEALEIRQPMKQAYREVYLLTEAEANTRMYSNRMAAHILKQHQFKALTSLRGWKYSLMGTYDDGRDNTIASFSLPEHGIEAEYWINEIHADDAFNDAGIWLYVATDQVRFVNKESGEVLQMVDIPKIVLSEVMRDVDLFVGVCSVGNDPEWRDNGGIPQYRDYWTSYSFGDLTEVAQTRKKVLETLIPRLKIKNIAAVDGRFLKVKGKVRNYKIHIGSTNILMEPNDQYLCIVPDRKSTTKSDNIFLPFEGDQGLSIVLSKAFLLAEDDKITDRSILSQLKR